MRSIRYRIFIQIIIGSSLLSGCAYNSVEEPIIISVQDFSGSIDENPMKGQVIGQLSASVTQGELSFSIKAQTPLDAIMVNSLGEILVNDVAAFDYENNTLISALVEVSNGSEMEEIGIRIEVNNLAEDGEGLFADDFVTDFNENPFNGAVIGKISASSTEGMISYQLLEVIPEGSIDLNPISGEITVADSTLFKFDDTTQLVGLAEVTDGVNMTSVSITINLLQVFNIWSGQRITFTKLESANPENEANQDRITENVWITRGNEGGQIYNIKIEDEADRNASPQGTEWAVGTTADLANLEFAPFRAAVVSPQDVIGKDLVLHLISDDIYIDVKFSQWSRRRRGGFTYERSTE